jgi:hypothetical protein
MAPFTLFSHEKRIPNYFMQDFHHQAIPEEDE